MRTATLPLCLALGLAACPEPLPPGPPPAPAPPPTAAIDLDLAGPLTVELAPAPSGGGARLAVFSLNDHTLVVVDVEPGGPSERARVVMPVTLTAPQMVFSPDATRLFVSGTARDQGPERTRPVQSIVDLTSTPAGVNELDEMGFISQVAWGRREIVLMDGKLTELDPTYGTPNVVRRCDPRSCGTIDRHATRLVTGRGQALQSVRPWPSLQVGVTLEHLGPIESLGTLGDRLFIGPGIDGARSPVWDTTTGELLAALPGRRLLTEGEVVVASSSGPSGERADVLDVHVVTTGAHVRLGFDDADTWNIGAGVLAVSDGDGLRLWRLADLAALARPVAPPPALAPGVDAQASWAWLFTRGHRFTASHHPETGVPLARPATCRVAWSGAWREDEPLPASWVACRDAAAPADAQIDPVPMEQWAGLWVVRDGRAQRADGVTSLVPR
ncbi:MAG: hypothetical protein IT385_09105 [Deltaproteobacteria bacterium]|nr:hypothetical protein [Deltaproteobacteria bacterium]